MTCLFLTRIRFSSVVAVVCYGIRLFVLLLVLCQGTHAQKEREGNLSRPVTESHPTVTENPDSVDKSLALGFTYLSKGDLEQAAEAFRTMLRFQPKSYEAHYWLGRTYYVQGEYEEAIVAFQAAVGLLPDWSEAHADLGRSHFRLHHYDAAEAGFLKALSLGTETSVPPKRVITPSIIEKADPTWRARVAPLSHADIYYHLALISFEGAFLDEAAEYCRESLRAEPSAQAFFQLGLVYLRKNALPEAEGAFRQAIDQNPLLTQAHYQLALLHFKQGKETEAEKEMETFRQLKEAAEQLEPDVNKAPALVSRGWFYLNEKKYEEAVGAYQKALWHNPDLVPAYNGLGHTYALLGRFEEAKQVLQKGLRLKPQMAEVHAGLGFIRLKEAEASQSDQDYEAALSAYRKATALKSDFPEALLNQGNLALKLSRLQEAKEAFEALLSLYESPSLDSRVEMEVWGVGRGEPPKSHLTRVHMALGKIYARQKDLPAAIRHYQAALKEDPNLVEAYYDISLLAVSEGRHNIAVEYCKAVLKRKPDMVEAHYLMGKIYAEQKQYEQAEKAYQRAIEIQPLFAGTYERLAYLYGVWGRYPNEALKLAKKAVELQSDSAVNLNTLSWLHYLHKDYVQAEDAIKKALMLQPDNPLYREGLEVIQRARVGKNEASKK